MDLRPLFIVVFLGSQLLIPISYYAKEGNRYDAYDERFAWRMFSPIRMVRCDPEFKVGGKAVSLTAQYHVTWSTLSKRGRPDVIRALVDDLCERNEGQSVTLTLRCKEAGGDVVTLEDGTTNLCEGEGGFR